MKWSNDQIWTFYRCKWCTSGKYPFNITYINSNTCVHSFIFVMYFLSLNMWGFFYRHVSYIKCASFFLFFFFLILFARQCMQRSSGVFLTETAAPKEGAERPRGAAVRLSLQSRGREGGLLQRLLGPYAAKVLIKLFVCIWRAVETIFNLSSNFVHFAGSEVTITKLGTLCFLFARTKLLFPAFMTRPKSPFQPTGLRFKKSESYF